MKDFGTHELKLVRAISPQKNFFHIFKEFSKSTNFGILEM